MGEVGPLIQRTIKQGDFARSVDDVATISELFARFRRLLTVGRPPFGPFDDGSLHSTRIYISLRSVAAET